MIVHNLDAVDTTQDLTEHHLPCRDELSDENLIQALTDGSVWAMELLYQRYSALLYSLAYRMVANRQIAEDLLQDVFLVLWQRAASYAPQSGSVRSWLISIMHHRTIDYLRSERRRCKLKEATWEEVEQEENTALPDVWDEVWHSLESSLIRDCLMKLLPEQRIVIELAYFHGWTHVEIAEKCHMPLGTVKGRMRLGLLHLKRELEKRGIAGL
jgi:RNA polymerase sigma factor (sigma-70 family)